MVKRKGPREVESMCTEWSGVRVICGCMWSAVCAEFPTARNELHPVLRLWFCNINTVDCRMGSHLDWERYHEFQGQLGGLQQRGGRDENWELRRLCAAPVRGCAYVCTLQSTDYSSLQDI